jgi:predicted dehydrogenase
MSYLDQPLVYDLQQMALQGWFGSLVHFYARYMHTGGLMWSGQRSRSWRGSMEKIGGGTFLQLGVHYLHLFNFIGGLNPVSVTGIKDNVYCPNLDGEDIGLAVYEYEKGVKATVDTAWTSQGEEMSIQGTKGAATYIANRWLLLQGSDEPFHGHAIHYNGGQPQMLEIPLLGMGINQPFNQHRRFLEAVRDNLPVPVTVESALEDLNAVAAFYQASSHNDRVLLADVMAKQLKQDKLEKLEGSPVIS